MESKLLASASSLTHSPVPASASSQSLLPPPTPSRTRTPTPTTTPTPTPAATPTPTPTPTALCAPSSAQRFASSSSTAVLTSRAVPSPIGGGGTTSRVESSPSPPSHIASSATIVGSTDIRRAVGKGPATASTADPVGIVASSSGAGGSNGGSGNEIDDESSVARFRSMGIGVTTAGPVSLSIHEALSSSRQSVGGGSAGSVSSVCGGVNGGGADSGTPDIAIHPDLFHPHAPHNAMQPKPKVQTQTHKEEPVSGETMTGHRLMECGSDRGQQQPLVQPPQPLLLRDAGSRGSFSSTPTPASSSHGSIHGAGNWIGTGTGTGTIAGPAGGVNNCNANSFLQPGDLIEVRVWDPVTADMLHPSEQRQQQNNRTSIRTNNMGFRCSGSSSDAPGDGRDSGELVLPSSSKTETGTECVRAGVVPSNVGNSSHSPQAMTGSSSSSPKPPNRRNLDGTDCVHVAYLSESSNSVPASAYWKRRNEKILRVPVSPSSREHDKKGSEVSGSDKCCRRDGKTICYELRTSFVIRVTEASLTAIKEGARAQVSLIRPVADLYDLSSFDTVTVTKIAPSEASSVLRSVSADFVLFTIKDQFISRGEMLQFQNSLLGTLVYEGLRLNSKDGIRGVAQEIRHKDGTVKSGIVTEDTKITFRSRSARIIWLVQVSTEMWDYVSPYEASVVGNRGKGGRGVCSGDGHDCSSTRRSSATSCQLYFDRFVSFMYRLFEKWKQLEVTHSLTVIFFSRTYLLSQRCLSSSVNYNRGCGISSQQVEETAINVDSDGRLYEDHYKVVIENETRTDWESIVYQIKKDFVRYPREVGWNLGGIGIRGGCRRIPSTAAQGNILEAINVTLNLLQLHYMDRDLHRTGNSIVVVSPGCGVFEVDKNLAGITEQRMMDNGIGSDMLSLSLPPLHVAPFFLYKGVADNRETQQRGFDDWKTYFEVPHWMHLSFEHYDFDDGNFTMRVSPSNAPVPAQGSPPNQDVSQRQAIEDRDMSASETGANGFVLPQCGRPFSLGSATSSADEIAVSAATNGDTTSVFPVHANIPGTAALSDLVRIPPRPSLSTAAGMLDSCTGGAPKKKECADIKSRRRDLIAYRDFEDILEACRPRYRGDSISNLPSALSSLLRTWNSIGEERVSPVIGVGGGIAGAGDGDGHVAVSGGTDMTSGSEIVVNCLDASSAVAVGTLRQDDDATNTAISEWGSVNFDNAEATGGKLRDMLSKLGSVPTVNSFCGVPSAVMTNEVGTSDTLVGGGFNTTGTGSDSGSSPSSSFASSYGLFLGRSADMLLSCSPASSVPNSRKGCGLQLQPSLSVSLETHPINGLDNGGVGEGAPPTGKELTLALSKLHHSDGSLSSGGETAECGSASGRDHSAGTTVKKLTSDTSKAAMTNSPSLIGPLPEGDPVIEDLKAFMAKHDSSVIPRTTDKSLPSLRKANVPHSVGVEGAIGTIQENALQEPSIVVNSSGIAQALRNFGVGAESPAAGMVHRKASQGILSGIASGARPSVQSSSSVSSLGRLHMGSRHVLSSSLEPFHADPPKQIHMRPTSTNSNSGYIGKAQHRDDEKVAGAFGPRPKTTHYTPGPPQSPDGHLGKKVQGPGASALSQVAAAPPHKSRRENTTNAVERPLHRKSYLLNQENETGNGRTPSSKAQSVRRRHENRRRHRSHYHPRAENSSRVGGGHHSRGRKPWVLNPFRLKDEEEVLARRTHNRRRWSHVFPPGEVEFKRHAGPNWKSLCQPAVLPLTTDFHPPIHELNDEEKYEFKHYPIFLDAMDQSNYRSHKELLSEMVMQRIIQDYQVVPPEILKESTRLGELERKAQQKMRKKESVISKRKQPFVVNRNHLIASAPNNAVTAIGGDDIRFTLSMGHNVQTLSFHPDSDIIEVVQYHAKFAQNDSRNTYRYRYLLWNTITRSYHHRVVHTFTKFSSEYRWNKLDNLLCGDPALTEDTRYRRIAFVIIPDPFTEATKEHEYVQKFLRLLEFLKKQMQQGKDSQQQKMTIGIRTTFCASSDTTNQDEDDDDKKNAAWKTNQPEDVRHFILHLRKGTREKYEWLDLVMDSVFDTARTYRIGIHWLVASGSKIEAQTQLLQRRCLHFGLTLFPLPHYAISSELYLHPFIIPSNIMVRDPLKGASVEASLTNRFHFVRDGKCWIDQTEIECAMDFDWPLDKRGKKKVLARQYVHRTAIAFIRVLEDGQGQMVFCWFQNRLQVGPNDELRDLARNVYAELKAFITETNGQRRIIGQAMTERTKLDSDNNT